MDSKVMHITN